MADPGNTDERNHRLIADPLALGLAGFGLPLFMASVPWAGFFPEEMAFFALPLAMVAGGIILVAGARAYERDDTFVATALGVMAAFWLAWGGLQWMLLADFLPVGVEESGLMGTFFVGWTVLLAIVFVAALTDNIAVAAVLAGATLTFGALAIGNYAEAATWINIGGWIGIVTAAISGYVVLADVLNRTLDREILPMVERRPPPAPIGA